MNNRTHSSFHFKKSSTISTIEQDNINIRNIQKVYNERINFLQSEIDNLRKEFNTAIKELSNKENNKRNEMSDERVSTEQTNNTSMTKNKKLFTYKGQLKKNKNFLSYFPIKDEEKNKLKHMIIERNFITNSNMLRNNNKTFRNKQLTLNNIGHKPQKSLSNMPSLFQTEKEITKHTSHKSLQIYLKNKISTPLIQAIAILINNDVIDYEGKMKLLYMNKSTMCLSSQKKIQKMSINALINAKNTNKEKCIAMINSFPSKTAFFQLNFVSKEIENSLLSNTENIQSDIYFTFFSIVSYLSFNKQIDSLSNFVTEFLKEMNNNNISSINNLFLKKIFKQISTLQSLYHSFYSMEILRKVIQLIDNTKILTSYNELKKEKYISLSYFASIMNDIYNLFVNILPLHEECLFYLEQKAKIESKCK